MSNFRLILVVILIGVIAASIIIMKLSERLHQKFLDVISFSRTVELMTTKTIDEVEEILKSQIILPRVWWMPVEIVYDVIREGEWQGIALTIALNNKLPMAFIYLEFVGKNKKRLLKIQSRIWTTYFVSLVFGIILTPLILPHYEYILTSPWGVYLVFLACLFYGGAIVVMMRDKRFLKRVMDQLLPLL